MSRIALAAVQGFPFELIGGLVALAGTVVLGLIVVAFGVFVYRSVVGDGIRWPDERTDDEVPRTDDDEWKYR